MTALQLPHVNRLGSGGLPSAWITYGRDEVISFDVRSHGAGHQLSSFKMSYVQDIASRRWEWDIVTAGLQLRATV